MTNRVSALHRGLAVDRAQARRREAQRAYITTTRAGLVAQIEEIDAHLRAVMDARDDLLKQVRFLDEQVTDLVTERTR